MMFANVVIAVETRPPEKLVMLSLQLKDSDTHYHSLDVVFFSNLQGAEGAEDGEGGEGGGEEEEG